MNARMACAALVVLCLSGQALLRAEDQPVPQAGSDAVYFQSDVMPLLTRLGCNRIECHGSQTGKGGFRLAMFAADPQADYAAVAKWARGRRINRAEPPKSLLLLKATEGVAHGGGKAIAADSPEYRILLSWIAEGTPWADATRPKLASVKVSPKEQVLRQGQAERVLVTAVFSDGTQRDVSRLARLKSSDDSVAAVEPDGKLKAAGYGQAAVVATYLRLSDVARIVVPQPLPQPFPEAKPNNKIDELVYAKLKQLGIPPSDLCATRSSSAACISTRSACCPRPRKPARFWTTRRRGNGAS